MAIAIDQRTSGSLESSGGPLTFNANVTAGGLKRFMLVLAGGGDDSTGAAFSVTGATCAGVAMTKLGELGGGTTNHPYVVAFGLAAPATGTPSISLTMSGASNYDFHAEAISLTGVDQITGMRGSAVTGSGTSSTTSLNLSSAVGDLAFDVIATRFIDTDPNTNPTGGQTQLFYWSAANTNYGCVGSDIVGAASLTMSWQLTSSLEYAMLTLSIMPDAGVMPDMWHPEIQRQLQRASEIIAY